jgi:predicted ATPase
VSVRWNEVSGALPVLTLPVLNRRVTQDESADTDVFIDRGPVDTLAIANQFELVTLLDRGMQQTRKPRERYRKSAAIDEVNRQLMLGNLDLRRERLNVSY